MTEESPESTRDYSCDECGNKTRFTGIDAHGYGGPDECQGCDTQPVECTCETELKQDLNIVREPDGSVVDEKYHAFTGGGIDAEIGSYTKIICRDCGTTIWEVAA